MGKTIENGEETTVLRKLFSDRFNTKRDEKVFFGHLLDWDRLLSQIT